MAWFAAPAPLLPEILARHGRQRPRRRALVCGSQTLDWGTFSAALDRTANGLLGLGLSPGDRVGILMDNGVEMALAMFGAMRAGLVAVPLNTSVADAALAGMLRDCAARAIVVTPAHRARIEGLPADLRSALGGRQLCTGPTPPGEDWLAWDTWFERAATHPPDVTLDDEAPCNIIYSSGTTGLPKGIVHTHRRRLDWAYDLGFALRYHGGAVTLCSLGLYSNISWVAMLCTWVAGGTVVVMPSFEATAALETLERERITHFAMVPVQFQRMVASEAYERCDRSSLQAVMCCGSPLPLELKRELLAGLGGAFIELYGLTEGLITTQDPETADTRPGAVGQALVGTEIRIIDEQGRECPPGEPGEIVGRGRILMAGYLNRDDANAESTWTDTAGERWLRTGDIGRMDEEGHLWIVDRKKDMILSGGQNIFPADIETVMLEHPGVAEVAVIGVPSEQWGETPLALVVPRRDAPDADTLCTWTNARLGRQQRISGVRFRESLPRNPNGKVLKRELRDEYAARAS